MVDNLFLQRLPINFFNTFATNMFQCPIYSSTLFGVLLGGVSGCVNVIFIFFANSHLQSQQIYI